MTIADPHLTFDGEPKHLVATKDHDDSPGGSYEPVIRTTGLYRVDQRRYGKRYFIQILGTGCSETWVTDEWAEKWMKDAVKVE